MAIIYYVDFVNKLIRRVETISKESEFCSKDNLVIIKELIAFVADKTLSHSQLVKAQKILAQIDSMDGTKSKENAPEMFIY